MNLPEQLWDLHKPEDDVSFALFFAISGLATTRGYAHLTPDEVYERFKKLFVKWKADIEARKS